MRKPGEGVPDGETERQIYKVSVFENPEKQHQTERGSGKMKQARQRLAVFGNIKIPKFRVIFDWFIRLIYLCNCFSLPRRDRTDDQCAEINYSPNRLQYCCRLQPKNYKRFFIKNFVKKKPATLKSE